MRKILLIKIFLCMLFLAMFSNFGYTQNSDNNQNKKVAGDNPGHSKELILGAAKTTDKNLSLLTAAITKVVGLQYVSFCSKHKLILLTFDITVFKGPKEVIEAIQNQNFTMPLVEKQGTFNDIKDICKFVIN